MGLREYKPTSAGRRGASVSDFAELTPGAKPEKSLLRPITKTGGRNNQGKITSRFRGGGHKRRYRLIDFKRNKDGVAAKVDSVQYDPNRTARIALLHYVDGEKRYIIAPMGLRVGDRLESGPDAEIRPGNALPLGKMPLDTIIHSIEMKPGKGGQLVRAAGGSAQLMAREGDYATLRMPSGEHRLVHVKCMATVGQVGNPDHENQSIGKAGRSRWLGRRPSVRGVAMNPIDHPMGGGEGKSSGGRHPCTPWGVPTKGHKTRTNVRTNKYVVKRRGKK